MELPSRESPTVEFKSDVKRISDDFILDNVVALANTEGGHLYLGVEDDDTPIGIHGTHRDTTCLNAFLGNNTPSPTRGLTACALRFMDASGYTPCRCYYCCGRLGDSFRCDRMFPLFCS